ncbi:MAG: hypothetical protein KBS59_06410, partial [Clostridiales bacterium]|nr:hypothetical protein [Clostridiales bacterium]
KICDTAIIRNNSFSTASAVVQPLKADDGFVLAKFGMNPEKVTSHSASDGVTYYDEGRNVKISTDGTITYAARSILSGIAISEIIGYDILGNDYSFCDYVGAALALAKSLGLDAGDFDLALTCAERNGGDTVIALSYAYKGYTVVTENEYALRIEISGGYITGISCNMYTATAYDGKTSLSDGTWRIRSEIAGYDGDTPIDFRYVYIIKNSRLYLSVMRYGEEGDV